jgi:serine/threonine protein kinase
VGLTTTTFARRCLQLGRVLGALTLLAGSTIGKYVVQRKIAEGGMAEIYLCSARGPEGFAKEVVIKRVRPFLASDPEFVKMFVAEARIASLLNHANIVQMFDFDKHLDTYYLAMEYVHGKSLQDVRQRARDMMIPVPPLMAAHIGAEVAKGLAYAHRLKAEGRQIELVHRDVTPQNVLLSYDGAVKLTDFGIAKAGTKMTSPGMIKGKFAYMSPEQARGEDVDRRTDIFALGIVLWELLTGAPLFDGNSDVAVLRAVQMQEIRPPASLNALVPPDLEAAILKALDRDANKRFTTAQEFERALLQCVHKNSQSVEDTDVSRFLLTLFGEPAPEAAYVPPQEGAVVEATVLKPGHGQVAQQPAEDSNEGFPDKTMIRPSGSSAKKISSVAQAQVESPPPPASKTPLIIGGAIVGVLAIVGLIFGLMRKQDPPVAAQPAKPVVAEPMKPPPPPKPLGTEQVPSGETPTPTTTTTTQVEPPPPPPPKEPEKPAYGSLVVTARPWANVTVDGATREVAGTHTYRLSPGRHSVKFSHPRGQNKEMQIQVERGKTVYQSFQLTQ